MEKLEKSNIHKAKKFNYTFQYIDDLISLNNKDFGDGLPNIYPTELSIKKENSHDDKASYLDLYIEVQNKHFHTNIYDKRDSFDFDVVNYPFIKDSNILENPAYGVYCSKLISIARACDTYTDFKNRHDSCWWDRAFAIIN